MFRGLVAHATPKTFEQIFAGVDRTQVVLVSGEQDNEFTPGGGGTPEPWAGLSEAGAVARNEAKQWATPTLEAGKYQFSITGTNDADLYVRVGSEPTATLYDCRPYKSGSNESCEVTLAQPSTIHVMVRGYSATATYELSGNKL
ncbi:MAG: PPC domain-containing protein [Kofleriaceae bacterium]